MHKQKSIQEKRALIPFKCLDQNVSKIEFSDFHDQRVQFFDDFSPPMSKIFLPSYEHDYLQILWIFFEFWPNQTSVTSRASRNIT